MNIDMHRWYVIVTHGDEWVAFANDSDGIIRFDTRAELDAFLAGEA